MWRVLVDALGLEKVRGLDEVRVRRSAEPQEQAAAGLAPGHTPRWRSPVTRTSCMSGGADLVRGRSIKWRAHGISRRLTLAERSGPEEPQAFLSQARMQSARKRSA